MRKLIKGIIPIFCLALLTGPLPAQDQSMKDKSYDEIEKTQDKIEKTYVDIYKIVDQYPAVRYDYTFENGELEAVTIDGMPANDDRDALEVYLMDLERMKKSIFNLSNRMGVYYAAETEPKPAQGYDKFYETLQGLIQYPDNARDLGIEGTIYLKFVVDRNGNVENIVASEKLGTESDWVVENMEKEAIRALKASAEKWIPASVAGVPVAHYVVIPVQFKLDDSYYRPIFGARFGSTG